MKARPADTQGDFLDGWAGWGASRTRSPPRRPWGWGCSPDMEDSRVSSPPHPQKDFNFKRGRESFWSSTGDVLGQDEGIQPGSAAQTRGSRQPEARPRGEPCPGRSGGEGREGRFQTATPCAAQDPLSPGPEGRL